MLDGSWRVLGAIWGGFWLQVGGQVEAKLAPKSEKWGFQDEVKKVRQKGHAGSRDFTRDADGGSL